MVLVGLTDRVVLAVLLDLVVVGVRDVVADEMDGVLLRIDSGLKTGALMIPEAVPARST